jgi:hypothetical protein
MSISSLISRANTPNVALHTFCLTWNFRKLLTTWIGVDVDIGRTADRNCWLYRTGSWCLISIFGLLEISAGTGVDQALAEKTEQSACLDKQHLSAWILLGIYTSVKMSHLQLSWFVGSNWHTAHK